jgi:hypothetical protein
VLGKDLATQGKQIGLRLEPMIAEMKAILRHNNERLISVERGLQNFLAANHALRTELRREWTLSKQGPESSSFNYPTKRGKPPRPGATETLPESTTETNGLWGTTGVEDVVYTVPLAMGTTAALADSCLPPLVPPVTGGTVR